MIKINLLSEGRRPVVARKSRRPAFDFGGQDPNNLLMIAGFILGALIAGGRWYQLNSQDRGTQREVRAAQARYDELEETIEMVDTFERKKQDLERKIQVIKDLKARQKGPVLIMDAISRALPDLLWLESMDIVGTMIKLRGKAFNTNAVAAFIENLDQVPEFSEPEPRTIQTDGRSGGAVYTFQIDIPFKPPSEEGEDEDGEG